MSNLPFWPHSGAEAVPFAQKDSFAFSGKRLLNIVQSEMALEDVIGDKKRDGPEDGRGKIINTRRYSEISQM
jgi:hypothetical protein